ncbi:MAG: YicC/YloC family endoribonuclease [Burkholderiaceae bacterium]
MKPVASMTGFATASRSTALGPLMVELRAVNSRFLDLTLRIPDDLRAAEPAVRELITARVARGKMECRLSVQRQSAGSLPRLSNDVLHQLQTLERQVAAALHDARPLSVAEVLAFPGVVESSAPDTEALRADVLGALAEALDGFAASRQREGAALAKVLAAACDQIEVVVAQVSARLPEIVAGVERKLAERLETALGKAISDNSTLSREEVNERIRQEVTLYAMKMDVEEEIKRLLTHVTEVRRVLAAGGAVGRRLDFLMQELNREANTLGSKAAAIEMTHASVELKLVIEQMREQIQNLE